MFHKWLEKRWSEEFGSDGPIANFQSSNDDDFADDHEHLQQELFKCVMSKYPDDTLEFLNGIAQRGDEEVASLLRKFQKNKPNQMAEPRHPSDNDEVVPSSADMGHGGEGGGGD
jgi:hypothetical protein